MSYIKKPSTKSHVNPYLFLLLKRLIEMEAVLSEAIASSKNGGQVPVTGISKKPIVSDIYPPITVVVKYVQSQEGKPEQVENLAEFVRKAWSKSNLFFDTWRLDEMVSLTKLLADFKSWERISRFEGMTEGERIGSALHGLPYSKVPYGQKVVLGMLVEERVINCYIRRFIERLYYKIYNYQEPFTKSSYSLTGNDEFLPNEIPSGLKPIFELPQYKVIVDNINSAPWRRGWGWRITNK